MSIKQKNILLLVLMITCIAISMMTDNDIQKASNEIQATLLLIAILFNKE